MENLKEQLSVKGTKIKLQFSTQENNFFLENAGFTDEEKEIFELRNRGYTVLNISFIMTDRHSKELTSGQYSVSKVEARIRSIKRKMLKLI